MLNDINIDVSLEEIIGGCNMNVGVLDWSLDDDRDGNRDNRIAFGIHHFIAIYHPDKLKIIGILNGHCDLITNVKWINNSSSKFKSYLITGSNDKTIRIWEWNDTENKGNEISILKGHKSGINDICYLRQGDRLLICSTSADEEILIYLIDNINEISKDNISIENFKHKIYIGNKIQLCLDIIQLQNNSNQLLLAIAGTDNHIHLYIKSTLEEEFRHGCDLTGHSDWIRSIKFLKLSDKILLASASQDKYIRIWSIEINKEEEENSLSRLAQSSHIQINNIIYKIKLDSILSGHEDWIHSINWLPIKLIKENYIRLLSSSMDRTMIIWEYDNNENIWLNKSSVGNVGSTPFGFSTCLFSPDAKYILTHGFTGALHLWKENENGEWKGSVATMGHLNEITDMCLINDFDGLMTVGKDQTCRIYAFISNHFCEISRPQIHGHDFNGISYIPNQSYPMYASCSEEKVIRIFQAPRIFIDTLNINNITKFNLNEKQPLGASAQALGLTNQAIYEINDDMDGPDFAPKSEPSIFRGPSLEEHLCQNTLWPEVHKLYGHGDIVYCIASDPTGAFLASAAKAQKTDAACILIWSVKTMSQVQKLKAHGLTVVSLIFSKSGNYLISGSRDRTLCIFKKSYDITNQKVNFELIKRIEKAHARIIWSVAITFDEKIIATGSRDKTVKLWNNSMEDNEKITPILNIKYNTSVTAVSFLEDDIDILDVKYILAIGLEDGNIHIGYININYNVIYSSTKYTRHSGAIKKLLWWKRNNNHYLVSCSEDHSLRIFKFLIYMQKSVT